MSTMMSNTRCCNCRWWDRNIPEGGLWGYCDVESKLEGSLVASSGWMETNENFYCAHYESKTKPTAFYTGDPREKNFENVD